MLNFYGSFFYINSGSGRHLEKWIWRHISAMGAPIWTKFGSLMQNNMQITMNWSRSKSEVEFQYGGRLYFEPGSSYISAANGDISTTFGLLIDFDLLKAVTSTDTKPEVVFNRRGRHLEKWIWRHISVVGASILHYITLHKIVFRVPKITKTARTLYKIKGVMWEYSYVGKHLEKR